MKTTHHRYPKNVKQLPVRWNEDFIWVTDIDSMKKFETGKQRKN